ncbi:hypothetical protein [Clostridium sporogenes]|uniref:hypothetical protein n=1 Tax=Clostridium sporogenes TaxID=1509 RepID=UPI00024B9FA4|nr:hypothetical protein [Clostridium sporogenes]EHN14619.1 hypothetical protein IYC_13109 [Clostridium sporogenes PA 3679]MDU4599261.1 hypothetical protein [Clostridium sporogenes]NFQ34606.1 hypothetical protein [Clostridium sporogenes]NFQ59013.1 hypothetical protein [Clostridium sporogenes]NFU09272.1 hypothetical protein [Clostridium sporogenes]
MDKLQLKKICDSSADEIINDENSIKELEKRITNYTIDGKTISSGGQLAFCIDECNDFTRKLVYKVLCEVLDLKE